MRCYVMRCDAMRCGVVQWSCFFPSSHQSMQDRMRMAIDQQQPWLLVAGIDSTVHTDNHIAQHSTAQDMAASKLSLSLSLSSPRIDSTSQSLV